MIDILNSKPIEQKICENIHEYILENKQPAVIAGEKTELFHVSGFAEYHHQRLSEYLKYLFHPSETINIARGFFSDYPCRHCWLKFHDLIIDITIKQFADKIIDLAPEIKFLVDRSYFISNNPQNLIYRFYQEKDEI